MNVREAGADFHLHRHSFADGLRYPRAVNVMVHRHAEVVSRCVVVYHLSMVCDHQKVFRPVADATNGMKTHRAHEDRPRDPSDAPIYAPMRQIRNAVFFHACLILHSLCSRVPYPMAHHF